MSTHSADTMSGNNPHHIVSGLVEDRNKKPLTVRDQVNQAITTLIVRLPKLPEHQGEDTSTEMENTSARLGNLLKVINTHFEIE
jgi:hypothetical protein